MTISIIDSKISATRYTTNTSDEEIVSLVSNGISGQSTIETHVVVVAGQSNAVGEGEGIDLNYDYSDPRILQVPGGGSYEGKLIIASEPIKHRSGGSAGKVGFCLSFAKAYVNYFNARLILIPCASGGTGFADNNWNPGDPLFNYTVTQVKKVLAWNTDYKLKAFLWHQGEADSLTQNTADNYAQRLDTAIAAYRQQLGVADLPFIVGELAPAFIGTNPIKQQVNNILKSISSRVPKAYCVSASGLKTNSEVITNNFDATHFSADDQRILGNRYFECYFANFVSKASPNIISSLLAANMTNTSITLTWVSVAYTWEVTMYAKNNSTNKITTIVGTKSYTATSLAPDTTYIFEIVAINKNGRSKPVTIETKTLTAPTFPVAPTFELLFEDNFNNTGTNNIVPVNNGVTIVNDTTRGKVGKFSSSSGEIKYIDSGTILAASFSWGVWIKPTSLANYPTILGNYNGSEALKYSLSVTGNKVQAGFTPGFNNVRDVFDLELNVWTHICITYNGTTIKYFKNGSLVTSGTVSFTGSSLPAYVGNYASYDANGNWVGLLDKVQFWNSALSDSNVALLYSLG